jgi:hypothetical protein
MLLIDRGSFMPTFIVNSAILRPNTDPKACAVNTQKIFSQSGTKNVKMQSCYCCSEQGRTVFIMQGPNQDATLEAFKRVNVPVESIMEVEDMSQLPAGAKPMAGTPEASTKTSALRSHVPLIVGGVAAGAIATAAVVAVVAKKKQKADKNNLENNPISEPL